MYDFFPDEGSKILTKKKSLMFDEKKARPSAALVALLQLFLKNTSATHFPCLRGDVTTFAAQFILPPFDETQCISLPNRRRNGCNTF